MQSIIVQLFLLVQQSFSTAAFSHIPIKKYIPIKLNKKSHGSKVIWIEIRTTYDGVKLI